MSRYKVTFNLKKDCDELELTVISKDNWGIDSCIGGFWVNGEFAITVGQDCMYYIMPHMITCIENLRSDTSERLDSRIIEYIKTKTTAMYAPDFPNIVMHCNQFGFTQTEVSTALRTMRKANKIHTKTENKFRIESYHIGPAPE